MGGSLVPEERSTLSGELKHIQLCPGRNRYVVKSCLFLHDHNPGFSGDYLAGLGIGRFARPNCKGLARFLARGLISNLCHSGHPFNIVAALKGASVSLNERQLRGITFLQGRKGQTKKDGEDGCEHSKALEGGFITPDAASAANSKPTHQQSWYRQS